jgi:predicted nucleotidyltransferase
MLVAGIVAEFNPFHRGHMHLISKVREELGSKTPIVVIMSGEFVQRGIPAITDRTSRVCAILSSGVDVVLELPFTFATGSADRFAHGAIQSLAKSSVITDLYFGAEHDSLEDLRHIADLDLENDPVFHEKLDALQKDGQPYASAWQDALIASLEAHHEKAGSLSSEKLAEILREPNNTLAIAYLRELRNCPSIVPHLIHRVDPYHGQDLSEGTFASASALRMKIFEEYGKEDFLRSLGGLLPFIPETMLSEMMYLWNSGTSPRGEEDLLSDVLSIIRASSVESLSKTAHMGPQLAGYLKTAVRNMHYDPETSLTDLFQKNASTRCFSYARTLRALSSLAVGQKTTDLENLSEPKYLRLLGFSETGRTVLKQMREGSDLPILSRASDAFHHRKDPAFARMDELDRISHDWWTAKARGTFEEDFHREVIQFKRNRLYR